ncbi:hypothetical protein B0T17DRAFT_388112 [Bombardia bombarda]|uniref:Uncharacterized protein n=1 Tax=Bombardia bombarda TaxID=252184 RepID=A0AA39W4Z2_9PEZI|nr:hypothetical protein B0T17DRAFT_388112 [Bombardia bombarda]
MNWESHGSKRRHPTACLPWLQPLATTVCMMTAGWVRRSTSTKAFFRRPPTTICLPSFSRAFSLFIYVSAHIHFHYDTPLIGIGGICPAILLSLLSLSCC